MKRILATLLAVCMVLSMLVVVPFTATAEVTGADESNLGANEALVGYKAVTPTVKKGTYTDLEGVEVLGFQTNYEISTIAGLKNFAALVNSGTTFEGVTIYLTADVDLSEAGFTGIPNFAGTFDGQSYKVTLKGGRLFTVVTGPAVIQNVEIDGISLGMIGSASGIAGGAVTLHNLKNSSTVGTNSARIGGILGDLKAGTVNVTNCTNSAPVTSNAGSGLSAGIVGVVTAGAGGTIENCLNEGAFNGKEYVGGIMGLHYAGATLTIRNCVNTASITGSAYMAGIAGCSTGVMIVENCTNKGAVAGKIQAVQSKCVGGIVGQTGSTSSITNCWNTSTGVVSNVKGQVVANTSAPGENVGGIIGLAGAVTVNIGNCKNDASVTGTEGQSVGGIIGCCPGINNGVANCTNTGAITASNGGQVVGGIVGKDYGIVTVYTNCKNTGAVMAGRKGEVVDHLGGLFAGGLVGSAGKITVNNFENTGAITATGAGADGHSYVGGIAATVNNGITATNCTNSGQITASGNKLGGMLGNLYGQEASLLQNCTNNGKVTTNGGICGGLIGYTTAGNISILGCKNYGVINGTLSGSVKVGGIIGCYDVNASLSITDTENHGNITIGNHQHVGGFIGECNGIPTLTNCTNFGNIQSNNQRISGFLGFARGAVMNNCKNYGAVTAGTERAGAFIGYGNDGTFKLTDCNNYGAITGTQAGGLIGLACSATTLTNCANYGPVVSSNLAGTGIIGQAIAAADPQLVNVRNYAKVTNKAGVTSASWFVGYADPFGTADSASADYSTKTQWVGYQVKTDEAGVLRLVGSIDNIEYNSVGFEITVSYKDGDDTVTKTLTKSLTNAYTSLLADGDPITAPAYRGADARLFALVIEDLPTGVELTFNVTTYSLLTYDAEIVNGESATFTVTLG